MSILVGGRTRVLVQGITGTEGRFHTERMVTYGTSVVAGVTPGKGGQTHQGIPVFDTVDQAVRETEADSSVIFVPPAFAPDAIMEAADSGMELVVCITEGIPTSDMVEVKNFLRTTDTRLVGPNCPGIISPGKAKLGIMPGFIHEPGPVGVLSRSGTLTYEAVYQLTGLGIGQSTCVGIGGDPVIGSTFVDLLALFARDDDTECVVLIGEIGGRAEEEAAEWIVSTGFAKPVVAFVAGRTAPPGRRMGHAGAIVAGGTGTAEEKMAALEKAGIPVAESPASIGATMKSLLEKRQ
ncbi:MAG: succinate--CoA ligase subunit alpha [Fidelibacterota bacterium]